MSVLSYLVFKVMAQDLFLMFVWPSPHREVNSPNCCQQVLTKSPFFIEKYLFHKKTLSAGKVANIHTLKSAYFQKLAIYFAISHFSVLLAIFFACKQESSLVNLSPVELSNNSIENGLFSGQALAVKTQAQSQEGERVTSE